MFCSKLSTLVKPVRDRLSEVKDKAELTWGGCFLSSCWNSAAHCKLNRVNFSDSTETQRTVRTSPQGYKREKRYKNDLNVSRSFSVGFSGKRAAIV